jgi:hypothetical protein
MLTSLPGPQSACPSIKGRTGSRHVGPTQGLGKAFNDNR